MHSRGPMEPLKCKLCRYPHVLYYYVLYTMVTKHFVTMLPLSNYDAITGIYASEYCIMVTPEALDQFS